MKNSRSKVSDRRKKSTPRKAAQLNVTTENRKAGQVHSGRVHRTPDGTIEENSEEAAP